jgi:hypothetical protein
LLVLRPDDPDRDVRFAFVKAPHQRHIVPVRIFAFPYPLLLLAIWTGVLVAGDYVVLETSALQLRAGGFATTVGEITRSELGRGAVRQRGIDIGYSYSVNGMGYMGSQYRYDERNGALDYRAITNSFQRGSRKTVYYNPAKPADSVLSPGLDGCDLLLALFAIPLNIITFAVWVAVVRAKRGPKRLVPAGGVRILQQSGETRVQLAEFSPWAAGFFGLAAAGFASAILVVSIRGFAPSLRFMADALLVVLAAGWGAFLWTAQRLRSGRHDLRIHCTARTLVLPPAGGRKEPLLVAWGEIVAVSMHRRVSHSPSGQYFSYVPALDRAAVNAQPQSLYLVNWGWTEAKARAFAGWLSQELGVRFRAMD